MNISPETLRKTARIIIALGVACALLFMIFHWYVFTRPHTPSYTNEPKNWIDKKDAAIAHVNVERATNERSTYDDRGILIYNDGRLNTAFQSYIIYHGNFFADYAVEDNTIQLELGPNMDPANGIMEAFIIERFENGKMWITIFVDQEWIMRMHDTRLIWGANFSQERKARFVPLRRGVYMDSVEDDSERFIAPTEPGGIWQQKGGLIMGDMSREEWFSNDLNERIVVHFH